MRSASLFFAFGAVFAGIAFLVPGCGSSVTTTTTGSGGHGGSSYVSTADGAPGTGGSFSTGDAGGLPDGGVIDASTTGVGGGVVDGGPIDASPVDSGPACPSSGDACTMCLSTGCPSAYCACYGNLDCGALFQCFKTCMPGDSACVQACDTAHQNGISAAALLSDCAAAKCPAACPGTQALTPCQQCLYSKCDVQMNTCGANPECVALFACAKPCNGDMACVSQCEAAHPNGLSDATKVYACSKVGCAGICN
jgi:hypothetical protein